jgi:mRNA interferase MazF
MKHYQLGEIVLLLFPFAGAQRAKRRPALVLLDTGDADVVVARVTSQARQSPYDVKITDWQKAGLRLPSIVRLHKLATLEKALVDQRLGTLAAADWVKVRAMIQQMWSSI